MVCFTRNLVRMKWIGICYLFIVSLLSPIYILLLDYMYNDLESFLVILLHFFMLPIVIVSLIQWVYVKWLIGSSVEYVRIELKGDKLKVIVISGLGLLHLVILIMFVVNKNIFYMILMILVYVLFTCFNFTEIYLSREYLIINNDVFETKNITKIKESNYRVYIKLKDNSVHRIWCRNPKVSKDIEQRVQELIYENNFDTYQKSKS